MAKKAGIDPKDVNKKLKALSTATGDTVKVSTKNRDSIKKNTKAVGESTSAFKKLGGMAGNALFRSFGSLARSGTEMTRAFINGETSLTAFASQIPLVGNQLSILTGLFDNSFAAFQSVATSGAAFNNSLTDLRNAAAGARMPLDQFASMIGANSDKLAALGGTATQGAQQIVALNKALGSNRNDLLNMGLNYQEINEALIDFQYLQRAGNRGIQLSQQQQVEQADAAARYTKNLVTLGKLTGDDVKTQQEAIAQAQMDVAMQAKLATMSRDERIKMDQLMADTLASGGQAAVDALKREFLGMPPMTEEAALYTTQFGDNINAIARRLESVYDANVTAADMAASSTDYMMDMINGNATAFAKLEPGITAAAAGLDGPMATLASQLMGAGIQFTDFIDESGNVDQVRMRAALEAAKTESDARDDATNSVATFMDTLKTVQEAFQTQIVSPLMDAVAPAFDAIIKALAPTDEEGNPIEGSGFTNAITTVSDYINNKLAPGILEFIEEFKKDPMGTIKEYFKSAVSGIGNLIKDFFLGPLENTRPDGTGEDVRKGGFLQEELVPILKDVGNSLVNGMVDGVKYLWENTSIIETMVAGIAALWAGKALMNAMLSGVGSLLSAGVTRMRNAPAPAPRPGATTPAATPGSRSSVAGGAAKSMLRRLGPLALLMGAYDIGTTLTNDDLSGEEKQQAVVETGGGMAGGTAGAIAGAAIGSVVPVVGTAIGGIIGGALGYWAGSSGAGAINEAITSDEGTAEASDTLTPAPSIDSPGAQLALMLTEEQITAMERIAAVNLNTFNTGLATLLETDLRAFRTMSRLDITGVAEGFKTFAEIPDLARNLNLVNSLDAEPVRSYTEAIDGLVESLNKLNEELSQDNDTMFTSRADAGELLSGISASTSGTSQGTEQLNNTMQQVLLLLREMRDLDIDVEKNTRNIIGSNLAQGNVSSVGR